MSPGNPKEHGSPFFIPTFNQGSEDEFAPPINNSNNLNLSPKASSRTDDQGSRFEEFLDEALKQVNADLRSLHYRVLELEESIKSSQADK